MTVSVGDQIPAAIVFTLGSGGPQALETSTLFSTKKCVLFALPGAFTPTCSAKHLPGFLEHAQALHAKGVDQIICLSVNDAFVMQAWADAQSVGDEVTMVADGNGDFTRAMGLEEDRRDRGMGNRSKRYAMVVDNGVIQALHVEAPGKFLVSDAESILAAL